MGFEIASVPLSPDADVYSFFLRQFQTGQIVVPLQFIPKFVLFVVDVLRPGLAATVRLGKLEVEFYQGTDERLLETVLRVLHHAK